MQSAHNSAVAPGHGPAQTQLFDLGIVILRLIEGLMAYPPRSWSFDGGVQGYVNRADSGRCRKCVDHVSDVHEAPDRVDGFMYGNFEHGSLLLRVG